MNNVTQTIIDNAQTQFATHSASAEIARNKLAWMKENQTKTNRAGENWDDVLGDYNYHKQALLSAQQILVSHGIDAQIIARFSK